MFWHGGDELVEHASLAEQRVGSAAGGAGSEIAIITEAFPCGAEEGEQGDGEGAEQPEPVTAVRGTDGTCKTDRGFEAMIYIAAAVINSK